MGFKTQDGFQFTGSGVGLKYVSGKRISFYISEQGNVGAEVSTGLITDSLVVYLDASNNSSYSGSGTTWSDISGNGNNFTLTNGPTYASANGGAIVFDGTNDSAVSALNQAFFQFGTGDYSYGLWVKLDTQGSSSYAAVLSSGGGSEANSWQIDLYLTNKYRHR